MDTAKKPNPIVAAAITVLILGGLTAAILYLTNQQQDPAATSSEQRSIDTSETSHSGIYANGSYTATGSYSTPGGTDAIVLTVTLESDVVVATELEQHATSGNSEYFQGQFASEYEEFVVGKSIDEVELTRVAGASLTSSGFNEALEEIKKEARAAS